MIWHQTGNKWLDIHLKNIMNFHSELDSGACMNSPLTNDEIAALRKKFKSINILLTKVARREQKKRKK
jgi:hypothetical protein